VPKARKFLQRHLIISKSKKFSMRLLFMGTPAFATPTLAALLAAGHEVVGVFTRAPAPAGRGMEPKRSPVHAMADTFKVPVFTPKTLRDESAMQQITALQPDAAVVIAYGMLLPQAILDIPRLGCLNAHASLLPRWRGAAPIHRAIIAGDTQTGVCIMRMEAGLDTGPVGLCESLPLDAEATTGEIHDVLAERSADLMVRALAALERGSLHFQPQPEEGMTYAAKIRNDEALIDWTRPALDVHNHIRGLSPHPAAFFLLPDGIRIKVLRSLVPEGTTDLLAGSWLKTPDGTVTGDIACGDGRVVRLVQVQRAGKAAQPFAAFANGLRVN
jgi:methionyl-tRNA formyltransferase